MLAKSLVALLPLAASFVVACAGGAQPAAPLIVPEGIKVGAHIGNNSVFNAKALTLRPGTDGAPELYAAVRNDGDTAGCNAAFSVTLYDKDEQQLGTGVSGLMLRRFYRYTDMDGTEQVVGCVLPGDVTMVAIRSLAMDAPIEAVQSVEYSSQYWTLPDLAPITGVSLSEVKAVNRSSGVAYTGALVNALDTPLSNPTVAVYPLSSVGRPLGVAYAAATLDVAPGNSWDFETSTVSPGGASFDAYPMGGPGATP
jgi:hypothetical protein